MSIAKGLASTGFGAALIALLLSAIVLGASPAQAQQAPADVYGVVAAGSGVVAGDVIVASIGGVECGSATAHASDGWSIRIQAGSCDGNAVSGATIAFTINGLPAAQTVIWKTGYRPPDVVNGLALTVAGGASPTVTPGPPATLSDARGLAVFSGGSLAQLEAAALAACPGGATIWADDPHLAGGYISFIAGSAVPIVNVNFANAYPAGLIGLTAVIVTGCVGGGADEGGGGG